MIKIKNILKLISSTEVFFCTVLWLFILVAAGTIAQKDIGLYQAQERYFSSLILWVGDIIPLPGGMLTLIVIFIGLFIRMALIPWKAKNIGSITFHCSVLFLLFGGFITAFFSTEGYIEIKEGSQASFFNDYHKLELIITSASQPQKPITFAESIWLNTLDAQLQSKELPFTIRVQNFYRNTAITTRENMGKAPENAIGALNALNFIALENNKEEEKNISAIKVEITGDSANGLYGVYEGMPIQQKIRAKTGEYILELKAKKTTLPFTLSLINFEKNVYAGTDMARSYSSELIVTEGKSNWRTTVEMNSPLRYKGYTIYQSAFSQNMAGEETSILAVVKNKGRLFPYISSILICIGLLIHLFSRLPRLIGTAKKAAKIVAALLPFLLFQPALAAEETLSIENFREIPVLEAGRIKPLDTFAENLLLGFYGKRSLKEQEAISWLAESLFSPVTAYQKDIFKVTNPTTAQAIGLPKKEQGVYSFLELAKAFSGQKETIQEWLKTPEKERSTIQKQGIDIYKNMLLYMQVSRSLFLVLPDFEVTNAALKTKFNLDSKRGGAVFLTYIEMLHHSKPLEKLIIQLEGKKFSEYTPEEKEALFLAAKMKSFAIERENNTLKIIPQQETGNNTQWLSPWIVVQNNLSSPHLILWQKTAKAYLSKNKKLWLESTQNLLNTSVDTQKISLEVLMNKSDIFKWSLAFYILSFLTLLSIPLFKKATYMLTIVTSIALISGVILHIAGIGARMFIMDRPPVANLYESILFSGCIGVIFALFIAWKRKDILWLLIASIIGSILQFIALRYSVVGDTMGMLSAVLNTNFWLATHVVTITIGYGCCFVASLLGHIYLWKKRFPKGQGALLELYKNMVGATLIALFFVVLGTILGGIWADQSWGRFWGWDPKENGALLIALWLIFILHGRLTPILSPIFFAVGLVLTNIVVALSWFGVNLLNVGLHSYGFTENIADNLWLFCSLEIVYILIFLTLIYIKKDYKNAKH